MPTERVDSYEIKGKSKKKLSTLKTIRRDESVTMLHALGRVFNPKRNMKMHICIFKIITYMYITL